jgi:hypothetical protein
VEVVYAFGIFLASSVMKVFFTLHMKSPRHLDNSLKIQILEMWDNILLE